MHGNSIFSGGGGGEGVKGPLWWFPCLPLLVLHVYVCVEHMIVILLLLQLTAK